MAYLIEKANIQNDVPDAQTPEYKPEDYFLVIDYPEKITSKKWPGFTILPKSILSFPEKYRVRDGDNIREANAQEKAVVDQAAAAKVAQDEEDSNNLDNQDINIKALAMIVADLHSLSYDQVKTQFKENKEAL